jgi:hypothetical protein
MTRYLRQNEERIALRRQPHEFTPRLVTRDPAIIAYGERGM